MPLLIRLSLLVVFSTLSMNLMIQCGIGMRGLVTTAPGSRQLLIKLGLLSFTVFLLWLFFSLVFSRFGLGMFEYIILFPASALVFFALDYCLFTFILKTKSGTDGPVYFYDGLAGAALFITRSIAITTGEAVVLSLGFSLGVFLSFAITGEIRRRALLENVPPVLRGRPLILISMGLLSLIFGFAALMFFRALEGG